MATFITGAIVVLAEIHLGAAIARWSLEAVAGGAFRHHQHILEIIDILQQRWRMGPAMLAFSDGTVLLV